jgi:HlyD family secretion protein
VKTWKILAIPLLAVISISTAACGSGQNIALTTQIVRGDLIVKVNGSGKIVYSTDAKLAFDTVGKIEKLTVKEGDRVTKGSILAQLETDNLELALSQAKVAAAQAQKGLSQAEIGVTQAEIALTQARLSLSQAESAKTQAESGVTVAQFNLDRIQAVGDIKDDIIKLQMQIAAAEVNRRQAAAAGNTEDFQYLNTYIIELNAEVDSRNADLQKLLGKDEYANIAAFEIMLYDPIAQKYTLGGERYDRLTVEDIRLKQQQVTIAEKAVESAQHNIDQVNQTIKLSNQNIELAKQTVEQAKLTLEQTQKAVEVAQKQLDNATITAPFDGIAANVDIKQGDYILTPGLSTGIPIYLVDPGSLEISTEIDELDIANVQINQLAVIKLDALPDVKLTGTVSSISVTPKVKALNSGLVVYEVKVKFDSLPSAQVKSGMNVSVDIVTIEKKGVILLPNKAIKNDAKGQKVVDVLTGQKTREQAVVLGLTDGSFTEVVSGVNEGEIVLLQP